LFRASSVISAEGTAQINKKAAPHVTLDPRIRCEDDEGIAVSESMRGNNPRINPLPENLKPLLGKLLSETVFIWRRICLHFGYTQMQENM